MNPSCSATSWFVKNRPSTASEFVNYGHAGLNRCTKTRRHLGDHEDGYYRVFRLDSSGVATIVRDTPDSYVCSHSEALNGFLDNPRSDVEQKEHDQEEANRRPRFSELRDFPGMEGFTIEMGDAAPDNPTSRLIHIIKVHWPSEDNAFGGPLRKMCVECHNDYPCETVRIAMGLE